LIAPVRPGARPARCCVRSWTYGRWRECSILLRRDVRSCLNRSGAAQRPRLETLAGSALMRITSRMQIHEDRADCAALRGSPTETVRWHGTYRRPSHGCARRTRPRRHPVLERRREHARHAGSGQGPGYPARSPCAEIRPRGPFVDVARGSQASAGIRPPALPRGPVAFSIFLRTLPRKP